MTDEDVDVAGTFTGRCVGGPLDSEEATSRFPKGLLVVNRPTDSAWVYDWDGERFVARADEPDELVDDETADKNRWRAALEDNYDVIALPGAEVEEDE